MKLGKLRQVLIVLVVSGVVYALTNLGTNPFSPLIGEWWRTEVVIQIGDTDVVAPVMDTPEQRAQGLSGWDTLPDGEGMLFVFPEDGYHAFWMKDMKFPIDIVWISKDGVVVDTQRGVSPETYPEYSFVPQMPVRYVLELPAGWLNQYEVDVGARVEF